MSNVTIPVNRIRRVWLRRAVITVTLPIVLVLQLACNLVLPVLIAPFEAVWSSVDTIKGAAKQWSRP